MNFVGRLTKDAIISNLANDRKVVNFTVAINDYYKPKGQEQGINCAIFINCSYWVNTAIAERLKKGSLVEISGRLSVNPYMDMGNNAKASLNCHVNIIAIHQSSKKEVTTKKKEEAGAMDDLPF